MYYWNAILNEVAQKEIPKNIFSFTNVGRLKDETNKVIIRAKPIPPAFKIRSSKTVHYSLGPRYPGLYLTQREAECMFWLVQELTISEAGMRMDLSARTIEFYVKNMKCKLNCASKKQLVEKILQTDLLTQLEKVGLKIVKH